MATIGLEGAAAKAGTPKVGRVEASEATNQRFSDALEKAKTDSELNPQQVAQQVNPQQVEATSEALSSKPVPATEVTDGATVDAQERARRALNLDPLHAAQSNAPHGDTILHGLEKIRGFFSAQEARLNNYASGPLLDVHRLLDFQREVMNFSLVVTVAAKLTGNATQSLESLLKGQ